MTKRTRSKKSLATPTPSRGQATKEKRLYGSGDRPYVSRETPPPAQGGRIRDLNIERLNRAIFDGFRALPDDERERILVSVDANGGLHQRVSFEGDRVLVHWAGVQIVDVPLARIRRLEAGVS